VRACARAAVSVLWLPMQAYGLLVRQSGGQSSSPLADAGLLLLLVLANHAPVQTPKQPNPVKEALQRLQVLEPIQ
jgi:hypothetical protein